MLSPASSRTTRIRSGACPGRRRSSNPSRIVTLSGVSTRPSRGGVLSGSRVKSATEASAESEPRLTRALSYGSTARSRRRFRFRSTKPKAQYSPGGTWRRTYALPVSATAVYGTVSSAPAAVSPAARGPPPSPPPRAARYRIRPSVCSSPVTRSKSRARSTVGRMGGPVEKTMRTGSSRALFRRSVIPAGNSRT